MNDHSDGLTPKYQEHRTSINQLVKLATESASATETQVAASISSRSYVAFLTRMIVIAVGCAFAFLMGRTILHQMRRTIEVVTFVARGDLDNHLDDSGKDEFSQLAAAVNKMIVSLKDAQKNQYAAEQLADLRKSAAESDRKSAMLEGMAGSVTYVDLSGKITYLNAAALEMFKKIDKHLPVRVDQLVGQSMDLFYRDPEHQRKILSNTANLPYRDRITVGQESFDLLVSGIHGTNKEHIGNLVSWECVTEKVAMDVQNADYRGQIEAISRSQAVIEFQMDGTIVSANEVFLKAVGYRLEEVKGKHHHMFVEQTYRSSSEYREFWAKLGRGEFDAAEYQRIGKGGAKSGFKPRTTRFATSTVTSSRSWNTRRTLQSKPQPVRT